MGAGVHAPKPHTFIFPGSKIGLSNKIVAKIQIILDISGGRGAWAYVRDLNPSPISRILAMCLDVFDLSQVSPPHTHTHKSGLVNPENVKNVLQEMPDTYDS